MKKVLGYVLTVLGVIGIAAYSITEFRSMMPLISDLNETTLIIVSGVLFLLGLLLIAKGGSLGKKVKEVPIYHGKNVVGYRRTK